MIELTKTGAPDAIGSKFGLASGEGYEDQTSREKEIFINLSVALGSKSSAEERERNEHADGAHGFQFFWIQVHY